MADNIDILAYKNLAAQSLHQVQQIGNEFTAYKKHMEAAINKVAEDKELDDESRERILIYFEAPKA